MWYVLYRDPNSLLVSDWKVMGSAPTLGYLSRIEAVDAAKRLHKDMYYDVQIVEAVAGNWKQVNSRSSEGTFFDN